MVKIIWIQICSNIFCIIFMWNHSIPELNLGIIIRFGIRIAIRGVRVTDLDILCIFLSLFFHEHSNFFIYSVIQFILFNFFVMFDLPFLSITSRSVSIILIYNLHCVIYSFLELCASFLTSELQIKNIIGFLSIFPKILLNFILSHSCSC